MPPPPADLLVRLNGLRSDVDREQLEREKLAARVELLEARAGISRTAMAGWAGAGGGIMAVLSQIPWASIWHLILTGLRGAP